MRKRYYAAVALIPLLLLLIVGRSIPVRAPELFGDGILYYVRTGDNIAGVVGAWGGWLLYGTESNCTITQIAGDKIDGADGNIQCHIIFNGKKFTGWIDFRGHTRKFCGGSPLPRKCYGE